MTIRRTLKLETVKEASRWAALGLGLALGACGGADPDPDPDVPPEELCENGMIDPEEADVDCGGDCAPCALGRGCESGEDCVAGLDCVDSLCAVPSCDDRLQNGDESDVDCGGGTCPTCSDGATCREPMDCASGVCATECLPPMCGDGAVNGDETDVDCGGSCGPCAAGDGCVMDEDCESQVCDGTTCAEARCDDRVQNGDESDVDCGGPDCDGCGEGGSCLTPQDCATVACSNDSRCVVGPTAGFTLTPESGEAPLSIQVTSMATAGNAAIASIEYDYGLGFETDEVHTLVEAGMVEVTQRVTDAVGAFAEATRLVEVLPSTFDPVRWSDTDRSPELELTGDGLGVIVAAPGRPGVRSNRAISRRQGVFYAEFERRTDFLGEMSFGIATATHPLNEPAGGDDVSVGVDTFGWVQFAGSRVANFPAELNRVYGFVLDYRGDRPEVHILVRTGPVGMAELQVLHSAVLDTRDPVYLHYAGVRRGVGEQARLNPGNNLTTDPFEYDPEAALAAADIDVGSVVLGWGQTRTPPADPAPTLELVSVVTEVEVGTPIRLSATATDPTDGTLTEEIVWEDLSAPYHQQRVGVGGSVELATDQVGIRPIRVSVTDRRGQRVEQSVDVRVQGALPRFDPVRFEERAGAVGVGPSGRQVKLLGAYQAGRANQGLYGAFRYFEATRLGPPGDRGVGITTAVPGTLSPYRFETVPPSVSVNAGFSIYRSLLFVDNHSPALTTTYGFAVDYRGRSPIVYLITRDSAGPVVTEVIALESATVPVYPFAYGFPSGGAGFDFEFNFGETAFVYDPAQVLRDAGFDPTGLEARWGD